MNPYLILGAVLAIGAAATGGYYSGRNSGMAEVQQAWDKEKTAQYAEYAKNQAAARQREQEMQISADKLRKEKDHEIKELNARTAALANSLRDRQSRTAASPSSVPSAASVGPTACTGKELYREDGEFLVRLAREADEIRAALKQCYAQYQAIK